MHVSIIVCTWNNCRRLGQTLDAIGRCRIPPELKWELVLVNNNSSDDTPVVARQFFDRLPLVYLEEPRQGLSRARNAGLHSAKGSLIIFTDDDVTPCVDWIATYWAAYQRSPQGFYFGGRLTPEYETAPPEPDLYPLATFPVTGLDWGARPRLLEPHERFLGANWACPAYALRLVGDFDVQLGLDASLGKRRVGEEWDLMERLRCRSILPWYLPDAIVAHFVPQHKCQLGYLAGNWEAHGYRAALSSVTDTPFLRPRPRLLTGCTQGRPRLAGVPWRTYYEASRFGLRYLVARSRGGKAYEEYASWRFYRGAISGHRDRHHQRASRS